MISSAHTSACHVAVLCRPPDRGVGFVHFSNSSSASQAVKELNGTTPTGCNAELTIRMANANKNAPPEFLNTMRVNILNLENHGCVFLCAFV